MDEDELRRLLAAVQAGALTPEEGAALLGEDPPGQAPASGAPTPPEPPAAQADPQAKPPAETRVEQVRRVRVRSAAARTVVVGRDGVHVARADGPHHLRREGDELVVDAEHDESWGSFAFARNGRPRARRLARGLVEERTLRVEIDPDLDLDFECDAGSIDVRGVRGRISGRVNAGLAVVEGFQGSVDLRVNAGHLRARGRLDEGASVVECTAGKLDLVLEAGSSVRITTAATLGQVDVPDAVVGDGAGTLDVVCNVGVVRVRGPEAADGVRHRARP